MSHLEPKGKVISVSERDAISRLVVAFDRMDIRPVAPAGLYVDPKSGNERFQLHRVVGNEGLSYTFEAFDRTHPLPRVGDVFSYRRWWLPKAMEAALDIDEKWVKQRYPDNGSHEHCLFSWDTIASYVECNEGYFSEKYGWITSESYGNFVQGDIYHLRDHSA